MQILFLLLLALIVALWLLRQMSRVPPRQLARMVKTGSGLAAMAVAGLLLLRGRLDLGLGLGGVGLWLLGAGEAPEWIKKFRKAPGSGPGISRVRSAMVEMELDHQSSSIDGLVLAGTFEGNKLSALSQEQCIALYRACLADDPDGARILEAYFDRRFAGWRPAAYGDADAGSRARQYAGSSAMSEDEAYETLGLQKGASREDVTRAHRALMKKLHPDHGGTTNLAARVNEAKVVLMRRHS